MRNGSGIVRKAFVRTKLLFKKYTIVGQNRVSQA